MQENLQSQHVTVRVNYTNKYHSPNIKTFEGFNARTNHFEASPPVFSNTRLQELTQTNSSELPSKKNNFKVSSMDAKNALN